MKKKRGPAQRREFSMRAALRYDLEPLEPRQLLSRTIYVDANAPFTSTGQSWSQAYRDLPSALAVSVSGDQINIAGGTYYPTTTTDRTKTFNLVSGVSIYGGYAGHNYMNPDTRNLSAYPTTLSGNIGNASSNLDNSYTVVTAIAITTGTTIDGLTITASSSSSTSINGGGLNVTTSTSLTVSQCTFKSNSSTNGGAAGVSSSSVLFTNCSFTSNTAATFGGAIYLTGTPGSTVSACTFTSNSGSTGGAVFDSSGAAISNCTFTSNSATAQGGGFAGSGNGSVSNCTFTSNAAGNFGGGFSDGPGSLSLSNSTFVNNTAGSPGANNSSGGGVFFSAGSTATVSGCTFKQNYAYLGAGMRISSASPKILNNQFLGNYYYDSLQTSTNPKGGGIAVTGSSLPTIAGDTLVGNRMEGKTAMGGGIYVACNQTVTIDNCTITDNYSGDRGGGIYSTPANSLQPAFPVFVNCIIWHNLLDSRGTGGDQVYQDSGNDTFNYCDVQGGMTGAGNVVVDPLFVRSPSIGADKIWATSDDDYGDLSIPGYSPLVDAGKNASVPATLTSDFNNNARITDVATSAHSGLGSSPLVDIGAFEAPSILLATAGGPYAVIMGHPIALNGAAASNAAGQFSYSWDFNNDGNFGDGLGAHPIFDPRQLAVGKHTIQLLVTDGAQHAIIATSTVFVLPQIVRVDSRATGTKTGETWANAFPTLQEALAVTAMGEIIAVAKGTYKPTAGTDRTATFNLKSGVSILGGYGGIGAALPDTRDVVNNLTILSGDIGVVGTATDNSLHVVTAQNVDASAMIDGITIQDGYARTDSVTPESNRDTDGFGGGIYINAASPTLSNCTVTKNYAYNAGGGIFEIKSNSLMSACRILSNESNYLGGGVCVDVNTYVTFSGCLFQYNVVDSGISLLGAGAAVIGSASFSDSLFISNFGTKAPDPYADTPKGGGIYFSTGSLQLANCTFVGNSGGGGIYVESMTSFASLSVTNSIFWNETENLPIQYCSYTDGLTSSGTNINVNPQFTNSYGLSAASPCIDAGSNALVPAGITTDFSGAPRIIDAAGVHDPGAIVDMGAYEFGLTPTLSGGTGDDAYFAKLSADGTTLQVFNNATATGSPASSYAVNQLACVTFNAGNGNDSLELDLSNGMFPNILYSAGTGNDKLLITGTNASTNINLQSTSLFAGLVTVTLSSNELVQLDGPSNSSLNIGSLTLSDRLGLIAGKNQVLIANSAVAITGNGQLDLADNDMVAKSATLSSVAPLLATGFNAPAGYWNGYGIISSTAANDSRFITTLGAIQNNDGTGRPIYGTGGVIANAFDGQSPSPNDVLIKYTYYGDADLSGRVDGTDYSLIDGGFNNHLTSWFNGDFNYDGSIDGSDYSYIDGGFNNQGSALAYSTTLPAVPAITNSPLPTDSTRTAMFSTAPIRIDDQASCSHPIAIDRVAECIFN